MIYDPYSPYDLTELGKFVRDIAESDDVWQRRPLGYGANACLRFCEAITKLQPDIAWTNRMYHGWRWPQICESMACNAVLAGAPEPTVRLLVAAHFS